jgi:predicted GTPase
MLNNQRVPTSISQKSVGNGQAYSSIKSGEHQSRPDTCERIEQPSRTENDRSVIKAKSTLSPKSIKGKKIMVLHDSSNMPLLSQTGPMSPGLIEAKAIIKKTSMVVQTQEELIKEKNPANKDNLKILATQPHIALSSNAEQKVPESPTKVVMVSGNERKVIQANQMSLKAVHEVVPE